MRSGSYGEYYQDCYIIKLAVDVNFENIGFSDNFEQFGTLIHEYIHFLQNMSTCYGYVSMAVFYAKMLNILHLLGTCSDNIVSRIITNNKDIERFVARQEIALGDKDSWTYEAYDFISIEGFSLIKDEYMDEYVDSTVPLVNLVLVRERIIERKTLNFGAMCIMESMADMLERHIFGKSKNGEFVQYDICEKLWEYVFGNDVNQRKLVFRCCEYSLMYENPGQIFYCALVFLKKNVVHITTEAIDEFFLNILKPFYLNRFDDWYNEMMRLFGQLVPMDNSQLRPLRNYIEYFSDYFHNLQKEKPIIFTNIFSLCPEMAKLKIIEFMHVACPLIINKDNEVYVSDLLENNKLGLEEYAAFYALYRMTGIKGVKHCLLTEYCKVNTNCKVTQCCYVKPLLSKYRENLCLLGQLLVTWKIKADYFLDS